MRISDWSSDVCSSDLSVIAREPPDIPGATRSATARSNRRRVRVERLAAVRGDVDLAFPLAGLCGVVAVLHPHQRVHRYAKRLLDPQPHLRRQVRSEEHTSELQSLMRISYAVFCLKQKSNIYTQ